VYVSHVITLVVKGETVEKAISSERRRYPRVGVDNGAFVSIDPPGRKLWHILDISRGGLAFRYMQGMGSAEPSSALEIVTRDTSFELENVPFRVVSDIQLRGAPGSPYQLRRCGVEFMPLSETQTSQINLFMGRYNPGQHEAMNAG
jgi:hypothetical protein